MVLVLVLAVAAVWLWYKLDKAADKAPYEEEIWPEILTDPGWDHPVGCRCRKYHN